MTKIKRKLNGGKYSKGTACSYEGILDQIAAEIESMEQWANDRFYDNAQENKTRAEALIEVLEVHNCGSSGGVDQGQPYPSSLEERYQWLAERCREYAL